MHAKQYLCLCLECYRSFLVGALEIRTIFVATVTSYSFPKIYLASNLNV